MSKLDDYKCPDASLEIDQGEVFIIGPELIAKNVFRDVIEISGIKNKGYSVVITSAAERDSKPILSLLSQLKQLKVHANHVVAISDSVHITNAESIEISHTDLLILAFTGRHFHRSILEDSAMVSAIKVAHQSGSMIIAIGAGADLFGEHTVVSTTNNPDDQKKQIEFMEGLGFAENILIDKSSFFENHEAWIQKFANEYKSACAGIGGKTMLQLCGGEVLVIKPQDMILHENGKIVIADKIFKGQKIASY